MYSLWVNTAQPSQAKPQKRYVNTSGSGATLHKSPIPYKCTYRGHEISTKRQEGVGVTARKGNHGRIETVGEGDKENKGGGEGKKKASHPSVPADRQWCFSPSDSLGWGSGALQRL